MEYIRGAMSNAPTTLVSVTRMGNTRIGQDVVKLVKIRSVSMQRVVGAL